MPGLVPGIHVAKPSRGFQTKPRLPNKAAWARNSPPLARSKAWIAGTSPAMTEAAGSFAPRLQRRVQPGIDPAGVAFVDQPALPRVEVERPLDVAFGVVVIVARLRVYAAHRADHFAGE